MACGQLTFRNRNIRPADAGDGEAHMMPKIHRLTGRFFTVLISLSLAICLPRMAFAGGTKSPSPTLCQISDTVYRADGSPAQGTVLISWQSFTTSAGQAVTPGSLLVTLDASGGFNASLAPNTGASPAGTYYKAIFKLDDGTTETEFWVVPNAQTTTIGAIRSKLVPSQQAAQFLTRDFADSNYVSLASTQSITGVKTFSASPAVPTPVNPTDAANKSYVDANSQGNLASPPPIGNVTPNAVTATDLKTLYYPYVDVRAYGAVGNAVQLLAGCSIAASSNTLTCPSGTFTSTAADAGKTIVVPTAGASTGCSAARYDGKCPLKTTITSVTSTAVAVLAASATNAASNVGLLYGTNNLAAIQSAIDLSASANTSQFSVYFPHSLGQGTGLSTAAPGGYLVDGTIKMPNSSQNQYKWIKLYGDGNTASTIFEADVSKDLISIVFPGGIGTEEWIDGLGFNDVPGYYMPSVVHCARCVALRFTNNWVDSFQKAIIMDVDGSGNASNILKMSGNTFEYYYEAVNWVSGANQAGGSNFDADHNVFDSGAFNFALGGSAWTFDIHGVTAVDISNNKFLYAVGRGISCNTCISLNIADNDFSQAPMSSYDGSNQQLYLSGSSSGKISGNHFATQTSNAVGIGGNNSGLIFTGNSFNTAQQAYIILTNGANQLSITRETVTACASPCITIGSGSLASGSVISDNFFASGVTTPIGVSGSLASGVYVALNSGDVAGANASFAGDLTARDIPGAEYFVSKYANIQAAITAAYNNGSVLGTVVDDRITPYSGPGFILYDSVTLKLAPTTYTITSTVSYNNGNNNVTAGIIALPGGKLIGASTSTNHGTIITAGNGLNADLIATSTVGTGIGSAAQWWHWGGFENLRVTGNGANQTAGNCFNIENMGETAFFRTIEVSGCKLDNILFTGASATPSDIANITTNSAGRYGFNFNNLAGMAVVHGLSGDSNTTSLVRLNGGQSGTLTILGFKTEEEISGQDPLITIDETGQSGAQPSLFIVGGYTFGRSGVNDIIKYVNGTAGTTPYISVSNFYTQNYVNAVNDTVNNRTTAAANMNKVPFYYGPTGAFYSGQAFTLDLNTFVQSPHSGNGILTETFGTTSSNETLVAASGTSTDLSVGGIGFRMPNRTTYGQTPELFAKMTYAFPGGMPNTQQWEFIPAKVGGDNSTRWIGDPTYRWDEIYSADVNTTTATVGTLNVTTCNGCGGGTQQVNSDWNANSGVAKILNKPALATVATSGNYNDLTNQPSIPAQGVHVVSGTMQGPTGQITGTGSQTALYSASIPAGTFSAGTGMKCFARFHHSTGGAAVTMQWKLGATTWTYSGTFTTGNSPGCQAEIEILTPSTLSSETVNVPIAAWGGNYQAPYTGLAWSENLANASAITLNFSVANTDKLTGDTFYCETIQ